MKCRDIHHDGGRCGFPSLLGHAFLASPAVANIRTPCLLADSMQTKPTQVVLDLRERLSLGDGRLEVRRQARATPRSGTAKAEAVDQATYALVFPSTTLSGVSPDMKSSKEGPESSVSLKLFAGVARQRTCAAAAGTRGARRAARTREAIRA